MEATLTKKDGKIQMDKSFEFMCSTLRNGEYTVTIKKKTQPRTLNQNALMWKWFQCIGACLREYTGEEYWSTAAGVQDIHDLYCNKFLVKQVHVNGKVETIVRGTSKLNTLEIIILLLCLFSCSFFLPDLIIPQKIEIKTAKTAVKSAKYLTGNNCVK